MRPCILETVVLTSGRYFLSRFCVTISFMRADQFVRAHRDSWQRLNELTQRAHSGQLSALSDDELHEMGALYRRASSDLARAQTRLSKTTAGRELVRSLNALVLRAHSQVYSAPAPQPHRVLDFILFGFPACVRRNWKAVALSALLLYGPALIAYLCVIANPELAKLFVPESAIQEVQRRAEQKIITGWGANTHFGGLLESPGISSYIMVNNIFVSLRAAAFGVTMGIGTVIALVANGLMLGGLSGAATNYHVSLTYWAVILPHGIIELSAISLAGGAGFLLARAIYAPGDLPRRDALKIAGGEAAQLMTGVAGMLVIAGLIEGFITPQPLPPLLKITFGLLTAILLLLYLNARPKLKSSTR